MKFIDREVEFPNRIKLKEVRIEQDGTVYDIEREEGDITTSGTPLNAANLNTMSNEDPNFIGTIKQNNRLVGDFKRGAGEIATNGSGNTSNGNRFLANLTAVYLGNRNWKISGTGVALGTWNTVFGGLSPSKIGTVLGLGNTFFNLSNQLNNGKWTRFGKLPVKTSTEVRNVTGETGIRMKNGVDNTSCGANPSTQYFPVSSGDADGRMAWGSVSGSSRVTTVQAVFANLYTHKDDLMGLGTCFEMYSHNNGIYFARLHDTAIYQNTGAWSDGLFNDACYFDFEFILKATMD